MAVVHEWNELEFEQVWTEIEQWMKKKLES